jgi:hypothetical protein
MLEKSTLVSGLIALAVVGAIVYLSIVGKPIPDLLGNTALIIVGFFFGSKVQNTGQGAIERMVKHG